MAFWAHMNQEEHLFQSSIRVGTPVTPSEFFGQVDLVEGLDMDFFRLSGPILHMSYSPL